ncbi:hypothetical protein ACGFX4_27110 [Kitasatospora sp. NPDC048365]|uniref:hypothetical protein n=1 Tax=Kitasatospora sp. NPDC048365 TaxID=3364050 RepID=UPI00371881F5
MKSIVAGQNAANPDEFAELALGVDSELFAGMPGETAAQYRVRMDAARDVLADLRREDPELAAYAQRLMDHAPRPLTTARRTTARRTALEVAA